MGWNRLSTHIARTGLCLILGAAVMTVSSLRAGAQVFASTLSNSKLTATVGISGQLNGINVAGRFILLDSKGNLILDQPGIGYYQSPQKTLGSFVTLRIDGGASSPRLVNGVLINTALTGWDLIFGDAAGAAAGATATGTGTWGLAPFTTGTSIAANWFTLPVGTAPATIPPISVDLEETLIHDMACFKFVVTNNDGIAHSVGLRFAQELFGPFDGPIEFSDGRLICKETHLSGINIPEAWHAVLSNDSVNFGGILRARGADPSFIQPDEFAISPSFSVVSDLFPLNDYWDILFGNDPAFNMCSSSLGSGSFPVTAVYFDPRSIGPGQTRTFVTYFGLGTSTIDFTAPLIAGLEGPTSLRFDANKPAGQQLTPNPFTVTGFVKNTAAVPFGKVTAAFSPPSEGGIALAPGEPTVKSLGAVGQNGEGSVSWNVVPTGNSSGRQTYSVSFAAYIDSNGSGTPVAGRSVTRTIEIPGLPNQNFPTGLQMVSFPFTFDDPTPSVALGLSALDFDLIRWNSTRSLYEAVQTINPGEGYWLNLATGKTVNLVNSHPVSTSSSFSIKLQQGWNQIGNPFLLGIPWSQVSVLNADQNDPDGLKLISVEDASNGLHQWISPAIFRYDLVDRTYKFDQDFSTLLVPFVGYWVKANKSTLSLVISPPTGRATPITRAVKPAGTVSSNNWRLRISATASGATDSYNFIGVAPDAKDGADVKDIEKPPFVRNSVSLAFVRTDSASNRSVTYAQDMQSGTGGRKQWNMVVSTPVQNADVTLSWPEIGNLPKGYELYITDQSTGLRKAMRQSSSMTVNSGASSTRSFVITAEPRLAGLALRFTDLAVRPTRGNASATISFTASQDANIQVRVLRSTGDLVRNLATRAASTGTNMVTWDYRDGKGAALPAGAYIVEVKGTTSDGQSARLAAPHLLVR